MAILMTYWMRGLMCCAVVCIGGVAGAMGQAPDPAPYLDDRSTGATTIRSLYNAINRQEYLRAFSYFSAAYHEPEAGTLEDAYHTFAEGYAHTVSVRLLVGDEVEEGAAGSAYFTVPVAIEATDDAGTVERFAGCYVLRLSQPAIQEVPPFRPLAIESGHLSAVDGELDAALPDECPDS